MNHQKYHKVEENLKKAPPSRPLARCIEPGCPAFAAPGIKRCPPHHGARSESGRSEYHRGNGYFYSSAAWRRFRIWFLRRHPLCADQSCKAPATQVDHIIPIANGGPKFEAENCQPLCHACHSRKTWKEQRNGSASPGPGVGGGETCVPNRHLPSVQLKKTVREFWARGVRPSANSTLGDPVGGQNGQKMIDVMGGIVGPGGVGGE